MTSFEQLTIPRDADHATVWAAQYEFQLRRRRMHVARIGLDGVLRETTAAMAKLNQLFREAIHGDPLLAREP